MSLLIGSVEVDIVQGDISAERADALVNAANSELWMGSGVAGALKRRGGVSIEREAMARGPIRPGEAVATGAGALDARWVIHAAAMGPDLATSPELIEAAARRALMLGRELGCESIAMPALGTGVGGFDVEACGRLMRRVVESCAADAPARVVFVLFGEADRRAFARGFSG